MATTVAAAAAMDCNDDDSSSTMKEQSRMVASMISSLEKSNTSAESTGNLNSKMTKRRRRRPFYHHHHLVLHFDINETILVGDEAGGDSREDCINKILAKSAFVRMVSPLPTAPESFTDTPPMMVNNNRYCSYESTSNMEPTHWWDGTPILVKDGSASHSSSSPPPPPPPPLFTGWQWPPHCCPYYRTKYKNRSKTFTETASSDGYIYRPTYELLDEKLQTLQQHIVDAVSKTTTSAPEIKKSLYSGLKGPSAETLEILAHMLPSFFETLVQLSKQMENDVSDSRRKLTIVFRTMGTDLFQIAHAVNAFATGQHPDYPNFYNPNLVFASPHQIVQGRWKQVDTTPTTDAKDANTETAATIPNVVYQLYRYKDSDGDETDDNNDRNDNDDDDDLLIASGDVEVLDFIHAHTICGIQDDYRFWKRHGHEPFAGKPVWKIVPPNHEKNVPTSSPSSSNHPQPEDLVQHILLDDNIHNLPHDSIASVRQVVVGMPATTGDAQNACSHSSDDIGKVKAKASRSTTSNKRWTRVESLTGPEIQQQHGLHLIRVPTVAPLLDSTWFMTQINQAQERFAELYYPDGTDDDEE